MAKKTNEERVSIFHHWDDDKRVYFNVVTYDAPGSRELRELARYDGDADSNSRKSRVAAHSAYAYRHGFLDALNDHAK